jgi:hypothetical protein
MPRSRASFTGSRRRKSKILFIALVGAMLIVSSIFPSISSRMHIEINDPDGIQNVPAPSTLTPFVGENPYAWATTFENSRYVPSDYRMLELPCSVSSMNLSSGCLAKLRQTRLAFVQPLFTASAYQNNGFYAFYKLHKNQTSGYILKDLSLLNVTVIDSWGTASGYFRSFKIIN